MKIRFLLYLSLIVLCPPFSSLTNAAPLTAVAGLNFNPPRIVVTNKPTRLMLIDGPPARVPIDGTGLEFVVNTDWSVFYSKLTQSWYILDGQRWLAGNMLSSGDWKETTDLPSDFLTLQVSSDWPKVSAALPPARGQTPPLPILISYEPTEMVLIDGASEFTQIPGTDLKFVSNTRSELFLQGDHYYLLISGRWFSTKNPHKLWYPVKQLPEAFGAIPRSHEKSYVLASVPGTEEAKRAMVEAATPKIQVFKHNAGDGLEVPYVGEPRLVPIEGTYLRRAENTPFQVISHNNFYYLCHDGAWFSSSSAMGPWKVATALPEAIYGIPPTDPAYNVTFVKLEAFDDSSDEVAYSRTGGYYNRYWTGSSLVYGTGWYYPGYYDRAVYWRYPHTYGYSRPYWDPYWPQGYHYSATYDVTRRESDWEWDLDGNKRRVYDYGPRNAVGSGEYIMYDSKMFESDSR